MHYTGMAAATFIHDDSLTLLKSDLLATDSLAFAVGAGTLMLLGLALAGGALDRAFSARTKRAEESERMFIAADKAIGELQKERDLRDRFAAALAHDLRTPLAAAKMSAQLASRRSGDPEAVEKFGAKTVENLQRMDLMIQDLLDAHRISAGQALPLKIDKCEIPDFLMKVTEDLTTVYGDRFEIEIDGPAEGYWDGRYMRRALENLCNNAVKYGQDNSPVKISVSGRDGGKTVNIAVHNEGEALAPQDQSRLFTIFSRGQGDQVRGKHGWGLGLTIVKGIAEAHGGRVDVKSEPGEGTTFTLQLPLDARPV